MVAPESEMELAYAGLRQLCGHMMGAVGHLPGPQREALRVDALAVVQEAARRVVTSSETGDPTRDAP
jgi:hypothetical protein